MKKLKIGVLMGGRSVEKEVSFNSGRTICDHIDTYLYEIIPLFHNSDNTLYILPWHFLHRGKISDFEKRLKNEARTIKWDDLKELIDFAYLALHGKYGEDGIVQGIMEILNIPYLGSGILASTRTIDKVMQKKLLTHKGIAIPHGCVISPSYFDYNKNDPELIEQYVASSSLFYPLIVKPQYGGSSIGVSVVNNLAELIKGLQVAIYIEDKPQSALVEEYIEGVEFTTVTLFDKNNTPLFMPPTEIVHENQSTFFDYTQKYMPGRSFKITPARFSSEIIEKINKTSQTISNFLDLKTIVRIDGFVKKDNTIVIIDINTLCGMAPSSFLFNQAAHAGMSHTDFINCLLSLELGISMNTKSEHAAASSQKLRVAVLLGGDTNERETSLDTGRNICYKLSPYAYEVTPIFVDNTRELYPLTQTLLVCNSTQEIERALDRSTKIAWSDLPSYADFIFIALHGGSGENGSVQAMLEMLNLPYNGSGVAASALCMDKYRTNEFLKMEGFNVPRNMLVTHKEWHHQKESVVSSIMNNFTFPFIIKPHNDGCSFLVSLVQTEKDLLPALDEFFVQSSASALIEEFVTGMELTVGVLGNETITTLPPSYTVANKGILSIEEKFLPGAGENQTPAPLPSNALDFVKDTIKKVYLAAGCKGYARIDCFYQRPENSPSQKERVVILEINTLPGLTPATCFFHQTAECGIQPMQTVDIIVQLGLENHTKKTISSSAIHFSTKASQKHE